MRFLLFLIEWGIPLACGCFVYFYWNMGFQTALIVFGFVAIGTNGGTRKWNWKTREYENEGGSCLGMLIGLICIILGFLPMFFH